MASVITSISVTIIVPLPTSHFAPVVCATSSKSGSFQLQLR